MGDDVVGAFVDTNLGTHIFISPPLNITVGEFKKYVDKEHFSIFPYMGEIQASRVLVKREGRFYLLVDSVVMKSVFPGVGETWCVHVEFEATHLSQHHQHASNNDLELIPCNNPLEHDDDEAILVVDDAIPAAVTVKHKRNKPTRPLLPFFKRQFKSFRKNRRRSVPSLVKGSSGASPAEVESHIKGLNYASDSDV